MNTIQKISCTLNQRKLMSKMGFDPNQEVSTQALHRQRLARSQEQYYRKAAGHKVTKAKA